MSRIDIWGVASILRSLQSPIELSERSLVTMGRTERQREIARRRKRKVGLTKVRARFAAATTDAQKEELIAKARRMSPYITLE